MSKCSIILRKHTDDNGKTKEVELYKTDINTLNELFDGISWKKILEYLVTSKDITDTKKRDIVNMLKSIYKKNKIELYNEYKTFMMNILNSDERHIIDVFFSNLSSLDINSDEKDDEKIDTKLHSFYQLTKLEHVYGIKDDFLRNNLNNLIKLFCRLNKLDGYDDLFIKFTSYGYPTYMRLKYPDSTLLEVYKKINEDKKSEYDIVVNQRGRRNYL